MDSLDKEKLAQEEWAVAEIQSDIDLAEKELAKLERKLNTTMAKREQQAYSITRLKKERDRRKRIIVEMKRTSKEMQDMAREQDELMEQRNQVINSNPEVIELTKRIQELDNKMLEFLTTPIKTGE